MREIAVIYGHKIQAVIDSGRRVRIEFEIDGGRTSIIPRPLASLDNLRKRMTFPPEFSPRQFTETWKAEHGIVKCRLIIGLTARHSGETSGVYMYGNGRMFARALRTRTVGYGDSGNSVLRDHPSCWRLQAYAFFEADNGADLPWQAPLKDGVSENHVITARFREMFRNVAAPYARFAKIAKASELVPFTAEWGDIAKEAKDNELHNTSKEDSDYQLADLIDASFCSVGTLRRFATPASDLPWIRKCRDSAALLEKLKGASARLKYSINLYSP